MGGHRDYRVRHLKLFLILSILLLGLFSQSETQAFTLNVVDGNGTAITGGFRYLVEEDNTIAHVPGVHVNNSIGLSIHNSHAPVVTKGDSGATSSVDVGVAANVRYYVSVLPKEGFANGGAPVAIGQGTVTVTVHALPLPTAQISVLTFMDQNGINNGPDETEPGLGGCRVVLSDFLGPVSQDAFGNPLGTTYAANGDVIALGDGVITTLTQNQFDAGGAQNPYNLKVGEALVKYIPPGKYGVVVVPPRLDDAGAPLDFVQTTTIEGTPTIDAWVKANEPPIFVEGFGTGFKHVAFGFLKTSPGTQSFAGQSLGVPPWNAAPPAGGTGTITGRLRFNHFSRPPTTQGFFAGDLVPEGWVGLNNPLAAVEAGVPAGLYAAPCNADSTFTISGVPPGTYQLVTWDTPLDTLFGVNTVTVPAGGGTVDLGDIFVFRWFGTLKGNVFFDSTPNGFRDAGEAGIQNQNINIRFRDGSIYQASPTDPSGDYEFAEVFPFFKWLVVEVDFLRYKATGMTAVVDFGGAVPAHVQSPPFPTIPPGPQYIADVPSFDQLTPQPQVTPPNSTTGPGGTAVNNPNTGNNLSRTEQGQVLTQAMHLFLNQTNVIDWGKANYGPGENGGISGIVYYATTRAEDDPRLAAADPWEPGIPRVTVNLYQDFNNDGVPDGAAIDTVTTDSWDDSKPAGCIQTLPLVNGTATPECADAFATWNQVRPGVFDGGYAFGPDLPAGGYIVEVIPPTGYELVKEEDKNVDFGDSYQPSTLLEPPVCVGAPHLVPADLTLFPGVPSAFAGQTRPLCDRKQVYVSEAQNTAADFFLFTEAPKAARAVGFTNNDLSAEFNVFSPNFGEKLAPAWIPVSFKDWTGKEVNRVYTDQFGHYNALLPSTYTMNIPIPTGVSPNMITAVLNDPILPNGDRDPYYNPTYSVTAWTFEYFPGKTTYLDTPLVPLLAFATGGTGVDTSPANLTPVISTLNGTETGGGALICTNTSPLPQNITIISVGVVNVLNPDYDPVVPGSPLYVPRNYGFGTIPGIVTLNGVQLAVVSWADLSITATVPSGATSGQILVIRGDNGLTSPTGSFLSIVDCAATTVRNVVPSAVIGATPIQDAIDAANPGDLILVAPGNYNENVIMNKPVRLQGAGAGSTFIDANPNPFERLQIWHDRLTALGAADFAAFLLKDPVGENEAPGIIVVGETVFPEGNIQTPGPGTVTMNPGFPFSTPGQAVIDGFTISGSIAGGGIFLLSGVNYLTISNNVIVTNQGSYAGGISVGTQDAGFDSQNTNIVIRNNKIHANSGIQGGGGISINEGSHDYLITENEIIGNFSRFNGAGISHRGVSHNGTISRNRILFNENNFNALLARAGDGGGIYIGGDVAGGTGSGTVAIDGNLIQGNLTGSGNGGGIRAFAINGDDVRVNPGDPSQWYELKIFNNVIVNNVAALSGAGISLQDVVSSKVFIINNTIAHNDTTATSTLAFAPGNLNSTPQPSGVVSGLHSSGNVGGVLMLRDLLLAAGIDETYANPTLTNNIIWNNRSFFNDASLNAGAGGLAPNATTPVWDLGVINAVPTPYLNPQDCILTSLNPGDGGNYTGNGNTAANPLFVSPYSNVLTTATVLDEGGNNISVRFTPLIPNSGNYHVGAASPAADAGGALNFTTFPLLASDFDDQPRNAATPDIGADEIGPRSSMVDFNGDLRADLAVYRSSTGVWNILPSNGASYTVNWGGGASDVPASGDYDGDGRTDVALYRVSNGRWYIIPSGSGVGYSVRWGGDASDLPVPGDYDGDGVTDIALYRVSTGAWYIIPSGSGVGYSVSWGGNASDLPAPGDYDGDGVTDIALYRVSTGAWYIIPSSSGVGYGVSWGGNASDLPVPGDYDGDGTADVAVYRASTGVWYILPSAGGVGYGVSWGGYLFDFPVTMNPAL